MFVVVLAGLPGVASAEHADRPHTQNLHPKGHSPNVAATFPPPPHAVSTDLAFWGRLAFQGSFDGFRVIDISDPDNPLELSHPRCDGPQGDVVVWENLVLRSWDAPALPDRLCGDAPVPAGFEGVHIFDVSNPRQPRLVGAVPLECGSHTLTLAGVSGGNLIVYSNFAGSLRCADGTRTNDDPLGDFMDILVVPLDAPAHATLLRREPLDGPQTDVRPGCHDAGVILGSVNKAACAGADTINVWDIGENDTPGGSLEDPEPLFVITEPGIGQSGTNGRWHSAAFTWDGAVLVAGWEPGGGGEAECEAADPDLDKSLLFYDAHTGAKLGQWVLPRPQGDDETCVVHNFNLLPLHSGRYVAVSGNYQGGTWVTDFTDPANPVTLAWSDPPSLGPGPLCGGKCRFGGSWSSYGYNGFIYESDITRGLNIFRFSGSATSGFVPLRHLNPQTQGFSLPRPVPG